MLSYVWKRDIMQSLKSALVIRPLNILVTLRIFMHHVFFHPLCLRGWHSSCFNNVSKKNIANVCLGWSFWENKKKDSKQEYIHNIWKEGVTLNNIICIIAILECKRNPVQAVSHHLLLPAKVIETCLQNIWYGYAFESKWK